MSKYKYSSDEDEEQHKIISIYCICKKVAYAKIVVRCDENNNKLTLEYEL